MPHVTINTATQPDCPYVAKDDPWSSHAQIKSWLASMPAGTRILDVGAATGTLGKQFAGSGFVLSGIEPHAAWAEMARPYYNDLICGMLDDAGEIFLRDHDVVVCADVLEHVPDPEQALARLVDLQSAESVFLVSVPNVAN